MRGGFPDIAARKKLAVASAVGAPLIRATATVGVRMNILERRAPPLARNVSRLGHLDLAGAGQVTVCGRHAYVGHLPNKDHLGTSILDISDPRDPRVVAT